GLFAAAKPTANATDDLATGRKKRVQHVDTFSDPHRIVPAQHHHHGDEIPACGEPGDIGEILQRICHHRIRCEVVLNSPHRIEPGVIGDAGNVDFFVEDLAIRPDRTLRHGLALLLRFVAVPVAVVLIKDGCSNAHVALLLFSDSVLSTCEKSLPAFSRSLWHGGSRTAYPTATLN